MALTSFKALQKVFCHQSASTMLSDYAEHPKGSRVTLTTAAVICMVMETVEVSESSPDSPESPQQTCNLVPVVSLYFHIVNLKSWI